MNKTEKEFYEYLVNLLITKGVFLSEGEQKELTDKLSKIGPPYSSQLELVQVINEEGKIVKKTRKKKGE